MNDQLSEAFEKALPEQPPTTGWGATARRRVARRRAAVAGVAGIAAVALAIPLVLNLGGGDSLVAEPAPSDEPTAASEPADGYPVESHESPECREADGTRVQVTDLPDGKLPEGAERIWLCGGGEEGWVVNDTELVGARDPLTIGVDRAVEAFNALNFVPGAAIDCLGDGATYHVVVEYPDGENRVVRGYNTPGGCDHFQLADGVVDGEGGDYLAMLQELWAEQREGRPAPDGRVHLCPAATSVWGIDPTTAARAVACVPAEAGEPPRMQEAVPDGLLQRILEGLAVDEAEQPVAEEKAPRLILSNEAGDPVTLRWQDVDGARSLVWGWGHKQYVSRPDAAVASELDALFEPAEAPATPGTEPPVSPAPVDELPECAGWVAGEDSDLDALIPAGRGCFVNDHGTLTVGDSLGPDLAEEIIDAVRTEREDLGFQPGLPSGGPMIMLATREEPPLRLALLSDGSVLFYHDAPVGISRWVPDRDLLGRMWAVTYGSCRELPPSATPSELSGLAPTHGVLCERDPAKGPVVELQPSLNPPTTTPGPSRGPDMPIPVPTVEPKES